MISHAADSSAMNTVASGLYSSHSPGRVRGAEDSERAAKSIFKSCAVRARPASGADCHATHTLTPANTAASSSDCQRKIVSVKGITPVTANSAGGMLAGFACNWAAEDDRPSAQTDPVPRQAAAPAARESIRTSVRRPMARARRLASTVLRPQWIMDVMTLTKATNATAPRPERGHAARRRTRRAMGGESATT